MIFSLLIQGFHFFVIGVARLLTGSPSLVYKRDVWEISINLETRILTKIINLQHTDLVCLCGAYLLRESG